MVRFGVVIEDSQVPGAFLVEDPDDVYINKRLKLTHEMIPLPFVHIRKSNVIHVKDSELCRIARKPWISTRVRDEGQCVSIGN
jgi:hypothetical protein